MVETVDPYLEWSTSKLEDFDSRTFDNFDLSDFEEFDSEISIEDLESKDQDISLVWYYHKLIYPSMNYLEYLDYLRDFRDNEDFELSAGGRITGFKVFDHGEGKANLWIPEIETDKYNPCDKFQSIRSSASRTVKKLSNLDFGENADPVMVRLDLTFPKEISNFLKGSDRDKIIDRYWDCFKLFLDKLGSYVGFDKLGCQSNLHLWKTQEPVSPHVHFHANILWAKVVGGLLKPLNFWKENKPLNVDKVRDIWKECIESVFGVDLNQDVDIYLRWISLKDKGELIHRLKYCRRKPLTDLAEYYEDHDFNPSELDTGFNNYLMDYSNQSRCFGLWTNLKRFVKESVNVKDSLKVCPLCGREVEAVYTKTCEEYWVDSLAFVNRKGRVFWKND